MTIKLFEEKYRDDLIVMVLQAKDALGRKPTINEDYIVEADYTVDEDGVVNEPEADM